MPSPGYMGHGKKPFFPPCPLMMVLPPRVFFTEHLPNNNKPEFALEFTILPIKYSQLRVKYCPLVVVLPCKVQ